MSHSQDLLYRSIMATLGTHFGIGSDKTRDYYSKITQHIQERADAGDYVDLYMEIGQLIYGMTEEQIEVYVSCLQL